MSKSEFDTLLNTLGSMQKAIDDGAADDKKIMAAATDGQSDTNASGDAEGSGKNPDDGDLEDAEGEMMKSLSLKLEDGTELDAWDGTQFVKSMQAEIKALKGVVVAQSNVIKSAVARIEGLGAMNKALSEHVTKIGSQSAGRRALLSIAEKNPAEGAVPDGKKTINHDQLFLKAFDAQKAGRIGANEVAYLEAVLPRAGFESDGQFRQIAAAIGFEI